MIINHVIKKHILKLIFPQSTISVYKYMGELLTSSLHTQIHGSISTRNPFELEHKRHNTLPILQNYAAINNSITQAVVSSLFDI